MYGNSPMSGPRLRSCNSVGLMNYQLSGYSLMTEIGRGRSEAAWTLIVLVGFAWGLKWIATRILLQSLAPLTTRALAVALGSAAAFQG
jgi:hypothetical protein